MGRYLQFSALKKSGSIEAVLNSDKPTRALRSFSALKKSGSIEAPESVPHGYPTDSIFRFEKKRLH